MKRLLFLLMTGLVCIYPLCGQQSTTKTILNVRYGKADSSELYLHIVVPLPQPETPVPAIVFIHGGGWQGGSRDNGLPFAQKCAESGYVGVSIGYRLTQESPFPAQLQDCKCAIRFLRANAAQYGINPKRIGVWGDSAGGHLCAMLGLTDGIAEFEGNGGWNDVSSSVQAVCDWYGPTDLVEWVKLVQRFGNDSELREMFDYPLDLPHCPSVQWAQNLGSDGGIVRLIGGKPLDIPAKAAWASPMAYVENSKNVPPFLIMQGDQDGWVPYRQSVALADALDKKGHAVTFRLLLNSGHGTGHFATAWEDDVKPFFDRILLPEKLK